jgi:hypothetical protein
VLIDVILIAVAAVLVGVYVSWRAGRLDRLHARVDGARAALDAALVRRSSVALELAACGLLDPATSLLLTRALRAVLSQPDFRACMEGQGSVDELLDELESAAHQVFLARKFYNDAVAATQAARRRWLARVLGLAGGAPLPAFFEMDDSLVVATTEAGGSDMPHLTS